MNRLPEKDLTGRQRKHLRGLAHHLEPVVRVGKGGVEQSVADAVANALDVHELIKVKVLENCPLGRGDVAEQLAAACGSHVAGQVGRIVILYRQHPERPEIRLPKGE